MKKLVVFSGAGISAESGLSTFRDNNGLWDKYPIEEVATHEAWIKDKKKVTEFYNLRRKNCIDAQPNDAHFLIATLEKNFNVTVITQNIDDLHERAGSTKTLHLHGEIIKSRSTVTNKTFPINGAILNENDLCPEGYQLRPHVVWFGESVPNMDHSLSIVQKADIFIIIGTSLQVYPAAGLIHATHQNCIRFVIDPNDVNVPNNVTHIKKTASEGMRELSSLIKKEIIN